MRMIRGHRRMRRGWRMRHLISRRLRKRRPMKERGRVRCVLGLVPAVIPSTPPLAARTLVVLWARHFPSFLFTFKSFLKRVPGTVLYSTVRVLYCTVLYSTVLYILYSSTVQ